MGPRFKSGEGDARLELAGLFLALLGAKLYLIARFASVVPFGDEWDIEAARLYAPYLEGRLALPELLAPHNEHRLFFTRLISLGVLELAGFWDVKLHMLVGALIHAGALVLLIAKTRSALGPYAATGAALAAAALFCSPFGWENVIWGCQTQMYLLIAFSIAGLLLMTVNPPFAAPWLGGLAFACASVLSMSSGVLAFIAALAFHALHAVTDKASRRAHAFAAALLAALSAVFLATRVRMPQHAGLEASSPQQLLEAFQYAASWPVNGGVLDALAFWSPAIILTAMLIARRAPASDLAWRPIVLAGWVLLQIAAIAYARASAASAPRYADILALGMLLNLACGLIALERLKAWRWRPVLALAFVLVALSAGQGLFSRAHDVALPDLRARAQQSRVHEARVAAFLRSNDTADLQGAFPAEIPYPNPAHLAGLLRTQALRALIPDQLTPRQVDSNSAERRAVRAHLALKGALAPAAHAIKTSLLASGPWLFALGIVLLLGAALRLAFQTWMTRP